MPNGDFHERELEDAEGLASRWVELGRKGVALRDSIYRAWWNVGRLGVRDGKANGLMCRTWNIVSDLVYDMEGPTVWLPNGPTRQDFFDAIGYNNRDVWGKIGPRYSRRATVPREDWVEIAKEWNDITIEHLDLFLEISLVLVKSSPVRKLGKKSNGAIQASMARLLSVAKSLPHDVRDAETLFKLVSPAVGMTT